MTGWSCLGTGFPTPGSLQKHAAVPGVWGRDLVTSVFTQRLLRAGAVCRGYTSRAHPGDFAPQGTRGRA